MTKLDESRSIALAVKKAVDDREEVHLSLSTVSKSHRHCMDKMYWVFMKLLKAHNELSSLCVEVSDPDDPLIKMSKFLAIVKGPKIPVKFTLLNCALLLFVSKYKMTCVACGLDLSHPFVYEFQSTTWGTNLKSLFLYFSKKDVNYKHLNDFMKSSVSYVAVLNKKFSQIANSHIDFGSLSNRGKIDFDSSKKVERQSKLKVSAPTKITSTFCTC